MKGIHGDPERRLQVDRNPRVLKGIDQRRPDSLHGLARALLIASRRGNNCERLAADPCHKVVITRRDFQAHRNHFQKRVCPHNPKSILNFVQAFHFERYHGERISVCARGLQDLLQVYGSMRSIRQPGYRIKIGG